MTVRNIVKLAPALLALLATASTAGAVALAASPAPTPSTAQVRVYWLRDVSNDPWQATLSPGAQDAKTLWANLQDENLYPFQAVPSGSPTIKFQSIANPSDSATIQPGVTPGTTPLQAGQPYTIFGALGVAKGGQMGDQQASGNQTGNGQTGGSQGGASKMAAKTTPTALDVIPDNATPISGKAQVRIVQSDAMMPTLINTGFVNGPPGSDHAIAQNLKFMDVTPWLTVDAGTYNGDKALVCRDATPGDKDYGKYVHQPLDLNLASGAAYTVYEHGGMGSETTTMKIELVTELAGGGVPSNAKPPNTGEGGLAMWPLELALASALALGLATVAAWVAWPRRRA